MNKKIIIGLALIILVAGVYFGVINKSKNDAPSAANATSITNFTPSIITYDGSSFNPNSITVKAGGNVTITNNSSSAIQLDSDPHPAHTGDPELNVGMVEAGQSSTFVVKQKGSFGYHNHLNSSQTGKIIIQ